MLSLVFEVWLPDPPEVIEVSRVAARTPPNEAERCDAYIMFGVALSLDSCLALSLLDRSSHV